MYAKIEPLIGFYEEYEKLYDEYEKIIKSIKFKNLLDVGCGNGSFLTRFKDNAKGIDISPKMVEIAKQKGLKVECKNLEQIEEKFDLITAIGDVLNYLNKTELISFLQNIKRSLNENGHFICDINTLYGFEEITQGVLIKDTHDKFLAIEAEFLNNTLNTNFTLFQKQNKNCYLKENWSIKQYFYTPKQIEKILQLKLTKIKKINLFSDNLPDKIILIFKKPLTSD